MEQNNQPTLSRNVIAFVALAHEYCTRLESAALMERAEFVASMVKLLPRLYICAADLDTTHDDELDQYLESFVDETRYETIRSQIATLMGEDDDFLEVFTADMQFSEGAITASISESLADIYQDLYDCVGTVREATDDLIAAVISATKEHFQEYWSQTLCNVLRALNHLRYSKLTDESEHHHHDHNHDCDCDHDHDCDCHDDDCHCHHH